MHPLSQFATDVAPHVDRLVLAVHRLMRTLHGDAVDQWRADTGLARSGLLINMRPFFLAGTQSLALLERLHRYALPATLEDNLRDAIGEGLIDDSLTPSDRCLELSSRLTALQASLIDEMWGDQSGISPLANPLRAAVDGMPKRYPGPSFTLARAWANLPRPDNSGPFLVHHLLTALDTFGPIPTAWFSTRQGYQPARQPDSTQSGDNWKAAITTIRLTDWSAGVCSTLMAT
ncbi:MAG: hypothetical protein JJE47_12080 [Acidimicrobiia bacterium]|nr:hypothetical protein [Acidimicrobiia bacterium]